MELASPSVDSVTAELHRVLASTAFEHSERQGRFLRHLVETALRGETGSLKETLLAVEVFGRNGNYDARLDNVVRMEAGRLRKRLQAYYDGPGKDATLRIELPKGGYVPVFRHVETEIPVDTSGDGLPTGPAAPAKPVPEDHKLPFAKRRAVLVAAILVIAGVAWFLLSRQTQPHTISVLPFVNLSADSNSDYLSDGLTDELTDAMAKIEGLRVIARTSAFQFKGKNQDIREIGRKLGADVLLEGSVQRAGERIRVIAQLNRASDGVHIWSSVFERQSSDLFQVQDEIAGAIAQVLRTRLPSFRKPTPPAINAETGGLYLRARYLWNRRTSESLQKAAALLREAIATDPQYAAAHALLADVYALLPSYDFITPELARDARAEAQKALQLDSTLGEVHSTLGWISFAHDWNWPAAESEFRRAIESNPNSVTAHQRFGLSLISRERFREAENELTQALTLDPLSQIAMINLAELDFYCHDFRAEEKRLRNILNLDPHNVLAGIMLAECLTQQRRFGEALQLESQFERMPEGATWSYMKEVTKALSGDREAAENQLRSYAAAGLHGFMVARDYTILGDLDHAISELAIACDRRDNNMPYLKVMPVYEQLHHDPRFIAILHRAGL